MYRLVFAWKKKRLERTEKQSGQPFFKHVKIQYLVGNPLR